MDPKLIELQHELDSKMNESCTTQKQLKILQEDYKNFKRLVLNHIQKDSILNPFVFKPPKKDEKTWLGKFDLK